MLAAMTGLSVLIYIALMTYFCMDPTYSSGTVMDVPFLLLGLFTTTIYYTYPIEVVSPGWITWRRLVKMYLPLVGIWLFYRATLLLGVQYTLYPTIEDMVADVGSFQVIFRIVLAILIFLPAVLLYHVPYTRKYNNTNLAWMRGYLVAANINVAAYLVANVYDTFLVSSIYIFVSLMCSLYFAYQELFVRLIRQPIEEPLLIVEAEPEQAMEQAMETEPEVEAEPEQHSPQATTTREAELFERLEKYMNSKKAWCDPDLSAEKLTSVLHTNRTTLSKAIHQCGYGSYTDYVNGRRVAEFIQIVNATPGCNYQQVFFDIGFRCKSTALRNFKEITSMTPSEYFQRQAKGE